MAFSECVANFVKLSSCSSLCVEFSLIQKHYNRKKKLPRMSSCLDLMQPVPSGQFGQWEPGWACWPPELSWHTALEQPQHLHLVVFLFLSNFLHAQVCSVNNLLITNLRFLLDAIWNILEEWDCGKFMFDILLKTFIWTLLLLSLTNVSVVQIL